MLTASLGVATPRLWSSTCTDICQFANLPGAPTMLSRVASSCSSLPLWKHHCIHQNMAKDTNGSGSEKYFHLVIGNILRGRILSDLIVYPSTTGFAATAPNTPGSPMESVWDCTMWSYFNSTHVWSFCCPLSMATYYNIRNWDSYVVEWHMV